MSEPEFIRGSIPLRRDRMNKFVMLNDVHVPHNVPLKQVFEFIKFFQPDYIIEAGDIINNDPFDHWAYKNPKKFKSLPPAKLYYEQCNREYSRPLRAAAPKARRVWIMGNHCDWAEKMVDENPVMEGLVETEHHIEGVDLWTKRFEIVNLGKLHFCHGDVLQGFPANHARVMVNRFRRDIRYGHFHDIQEATFSSPIDQGHTQRFTARCCGTLQKFTPTPPEFMKKRPHDWINAFTYGWIHGRDGSFADMTVKIRDGKFIAEGRSW